MSVCLPLRRSFSDEHGRGTFHSLGILPKRKFPVFHIAHDDDEEHAVPAIPFPRSTSPQSPPLSRPQLSRGASAPILLSNGKPLKPSLKLSSSDPAMLTPPQSQHVHLRARSEPSSPAVTPKNVHFPEKDYALATVRIFNRSARPAALSSPPSVNGDETETDGEETPPTRFPFPLSPPVINYEIDTTRSSPVPCTFSPSVNLLLESVKLSRSSLSPKPMKPLLTGSILVRNLAFEKFVAIRFTLDDWQTISEVGARYVESLSSLPPQIALSSSGSTLEDTNSQRGRGWDRFTFSIRLEDYAHSLSTRIIWLVARYCIDSTYPEPCSARYGPGGEWWDNNSGSNYRVAFRPAVTTPAHPRSERDTVSAPISPSRTKHPSAVTCKEHGFGLMVPPVPNAKDTQHLHETDRRSVPLRTGKLSLCNYAPPTVRPPSSATGSPRRPSDSPIAIPETPPSATPCSQPDEGTSSPTSPTLSTPSASPTIASHVIINGQPATSAHPHRSSEDDTLPLSRPGYIADWDWSAPRKPQIEGLPRPYADPVPVSDLPDRWRNIPSPPGSNINAFADSNLLYDAFITHWCFAQEPSPNNNDYSDGGVMAFSLQTHTPSLS